MLTLVISFSIFTIFRQPLISALILFLYVLYTFRGKFLPSQFQHGGNVQNKIPRTPVPEKAQAKDPVAERHKKRALELLDQRMASIGEKNSAFVV